MTAEPTTATTGATPGAGAMPAQAAPNGASTGATPATGAAGAQPAPATPPASPPADDQQLGDSGRRALEAERTARRDADTRAQAAEAELTRLREAGQSDHEKALTTAKREAQTEERTKWQAHIRASEVRSQLRVAGLTNEKTLALAVGAPEFAKLKVTDEGAVEQVAETVEAFKKDYPEMFGAATPAQPAPGGAWDGAAGGSGKQQPDTLEGAVMQRLAAKKP